MLAVTAIVVCIIVIVGIFLAARPDNMFDNPQPGKYGVFNTLTNRPALNGRQFKHPHQAAKAALKLQRKYSFLGLVELDIREVS